VDGALYQRFDSALFSTSKFFKVRRLLQSVALSKYLSLLFPSLPPCKDRLS
jgi:hypothetical protein